MIGLEFSTGKLTLYELTTSQDYDGGMPVQVLSAVAWTYYGERTVSYTRLYEALGADQRIDKLVRIPADFVTGSGVKIGQYVILEDTLLYRIEAVSDVIVKSSVRAAELTLVLVEENYNITVDLNITPGVITTGNGETS